MFKKIILILTLLFVPLQSRAIEYNYDIWNESSQTGAFILNQDAVSNTIKTVFKTVYVLLVFFGLASFCFMLMSYFQYKVSSGNKDVINKTRHVFTINLLVFISSIIIYSISQTFLN